MTRSATHASSGWVIGKGRERRVRLLAPPSFVLPDLNSVAAGVEVGAKGHIQLDSTYYDTRGLALLHAGITVRLRTDRQGGIWTVKLPRRMDPSKVARRTLTFTGATAELPSAVVDLVQTHVGRERIVPVAHLHTDRTTLRLYDRDHDFIADIICDNVSAHVGAADVRNLVEVQVSLHEHDEFGRSVQQHVIERLVENGCSIESAHVAKLALILRPDEPAPTPPLHPRPTVGELIQFDLVSAAQTMLDHDAGIRLGDDVEDIHLFRVAARRLRTHLRTFAAILEPAWRDALRAELAWIADLSGAVRDADVLVSHLQSGATTLPAADTERVKTLFELLEKQRDTARTALILAMHTDRYEQLTQQLKTIIGLGPRVDLEVDDATVRGAAAPFIRKAVNKHLQNLQRAARMHGRSEEEQLHQLRIAAKRARYTADAAPPDARRLARRSAHLRTLQDRLGEYHDCTLAEQWLRATAKHHPSLAVAAGQLIATERRRANKQLRQVPRLVQRVART